MRLLKPRLECGRGEEFESNRASACPSIWHVRDFSARTELHSKPKLDLCCVLVVGDLMGSFGDKLKKKVVSADCAMYSVLMRESPGDCLEMSPALVGGWIAWVTVESVIRITLRPSHTVRPAFGVD